MSSVVDVIRGVISTEKSHKARESNNVYQFLVSKNSDKTAIKKAIVRLFNVEVLDVNTISMKSKKIKFKGKDGERSGFKKALVRVKSGQVIGEHKVS